MDQRGSFSTSTYYRRKQLKPCGFNMRWQERRVTSNNLESVSAMITRKVKYHSNEGEVNPRVTGRGGEGCKKFIRTDPIARKNENVAALLSMYCERVARKPRGPAPPLCFYEYVSADNGNEGGERGRK
jgi:hypothetical protein